MTTGARATHWFTRYVLPGLAFKAVVIGGGYATGREIAEFFLPAGPWGGLAAMALATVIWSVVCAATFLFARATGAVEYRAFFKALLGRGWIAFEIAYALFVVLILAVFGAAAGAIGAATLGLPPIVGTLALMLGIAGFAAFGNVAVERLFAYVSVLLYGVYTLFFLFALTSFGGRIGAAFSAAPAPGGSWALGGITYAGYNIVGAVMILPVTRHLTSNRDAVVAGLIAGPLAMLVHLGKPLFHIVFQVMIFAALLESGTGAVHAVNQRIAGVWQRNRGVPLEPAVRGVIALTILAACMLLAQRIGLVALIANGYRALACVLITLYVLPLLTVGTWRLIHPQSMERV